MSIVMPVLGGIAQLSCLVTSQGPAEIGTRVIADFDITQKHAVISEHYEDGTSRIVEPNASIQLLPTTQMLVRSDLAEIDWLADQWKTECYAARASTFLVLREVSFGSFEGTYSRSLRIDTNPFLKDTCPVPQPVQPLPSKVTCVAAIN